MQELDDFGNPVGTLYPGDEGCPQGMICITEEGFNQMLAQADMQYNTETFQVEQMGDAEAIIEFTKDLVFLDISVILNMAVPLTIFAVYGLTIYAAVKYIQKRLS